MRTPKTEHFFAERTTLSFKHFDPQDIIGAYVAMYPQAYRFTLDFEGGYVNDPDDPGGCTNMGITIGTLTDWRDDPSTNCNDVANLSRVEAGMIYALNYWSPVWGNRLLVGLNTQVWDFGVNAGPSRSVRYLQEMIGSPGDGIMGPNTLAAAEAYVEDRGIETALQNYHDKRQAYYESLSTFSKYGNGWTRRNDDCLALSIDLANSDVALPDLPAMPTLPSGDTQDQIDDLNRRVTDLENERDS